MPLSTIVMPCNDSGFHSVEEASAYGLVSYDWSNAKQLWCNARPMGDGELLVKQAEMVRQASTTTRIGVCKGAHTIYCHAMCPLAAEPALQPTSRPFLPSARTAVLHRLVWAHSFTHHAHAVVLLLSLLLVLLLFGRRPQRDQSPQLVHRSP